MYGLMYK